MFGWKKRFKNKRLHLKPVEIDVHTIKKLCFHYSNSMDIEDIYSYTLDFDGNGGCVLTISAEIYAENEVYTISITDTELQNILQALRDCDVGAWNGFHEVDTDILDGDSFELLIECDDEKNTAINLSGTNAYPPHYNMFAACMHTNLDHYRVDYNYARIPKTLESDNLKVAFVHFTKPGMYGELEFNFQIWSDSHVGGNLVVDIADHDGEFLGEPAVIKKSITMPYNDLSGIQKVVRRHNLARLNGYDKSDTDDKNSECFQLHFLYDNNETINIIGSLKPEGFDDFRRELVEECIKIYNNKEIIQ